MKAIVEPYYDSDNSGPPELEVNYGERYVTIGLRSPSREIVLTYEDWTALVRATPPEKLR